MIEKPAASSVVFNQKSSIINLEFPFLPPPRRARRPPAHRIFRPGCRLSRVAGSARAWDPILFGGRRRNEPERMRMNERARNAFAFDRRHVAGHALASGAAIFVVRVFCQSGRVRAIRRRRPMTIQANLFRRGFLN